MVAGALRGTRRQTRESRAPASQAEAGSAEIHGQHREGSTPGLFIGGLFDDRQRALVERASRGPTQAAADVLQWGFVRGLESIPEIRLTILSAPFVGSYPRLFSQMRIDTREFEHGERGRNRQIGFPNLPLIKQFFRAASLALAAREWARGLKSREGFVLGYSLSLDIVLSVVLARLRNPFLITALIVPDLPEFMNTQQRARFGYGVLKRLESHLVRRLLTLVDANIVLTRAIADRLPAKPHVVIEGIGGPTVSGSAPGTQAAAPPAIDAARTIVYAGTTNVRYGVVELCKAFRQVPDKDIALIICGSGDGSELIKSHAARDHRIHYLGQLPRSAVLELEKSATLLVNPRSNSEEFTAYSFPSKILEYMSTGVPVLCYRLDGMPAEYESYLSFIPGTSVEEFAACLQSMLSMSPATLAAKGAAARHFVETEKNPEAQAMKVARFLREVALAKRVAIDEAGYPQ